MYPTLCRNHQQHCDNCMVCIAFDKAVKEQLSTYTTPPESHPVVVNVRVQEWIGKVFPIPSKS